MFAAAWRMGCISHMNDLKRTGTYLHDGDVLHVCEQLLNLPLHRFHLCLESPGLPSVVLRESRSFDEGCLGQDQPR